MAYSTATEYITRDKYLDFAGIDLDIELKSSQSDNPTLAVAIFLKQQTLWLYNYMLHRFDTRQWETDWDDDVFAEALLWQVKHVLQNGEDDLLDKTAYQILRASGLANRKRIG